MVITTVGTMPRLDTLYEYAKFYNDQQSTV